MASTSTGGEAMAPPPLLLEFWRGSGDGRETSDGLSFYEV
jgi:hypothetical protein